MKIIYLLVLDIYFVVFQGFLECGQLILDVKCTEEYISCIIKYLFLFFPVVT